MLSVALNKNASFMRKEFESKHDKLFGFKQTNKDVISSNLEVEVTKKGGANTSKDYLHNHANFTKAKKYVFLGGETVEVPFYHWNLLKMEKIVGPAVVYDDLHNIIIEKGWKCERTNEGNLQLVKTGAKLNNNSISGKSTPIGLELFNNRFTSVAEQMGIVLQKSAQSVNIRERLDFSCALFDSKGSLIANAPHVPVHLGSMSDSVKTLIKKKLDGISNEDVFMVNSPYEGGTHLPDITVIKGVKLTRASTKPDVFVAARGHHADIGGISPGSMPAFSRHIEDEGVLIELTRIVKNGKFDENGVRKILTGGLFPARSPDDNVADLKAQIASCEAGKHEILRTVSDFGTVPVKAYLRHVIVNASVAASRLIAKIKNGKTSVPLDCGAKMSFEIKNQENKKLVFDFSKVGNKNMRNFNAPESITRAAVLYCLRCLLDEEVPMNDGIMSSIEIIHKKGSMLSPVYPTAVAAGNVEVSQQITDGIFRVLGVLAESQGTCNNFTFGVAGKQFYETIAGGMGAGNGFDGADACQVHMTNSKLTDVEIFENSFEAMILEMSIRKNSGGYGANKGGKGVMKKIMFLDRGEFNIISSRRMCPARGLQNGGQGKRGYNVLFPASGGQINLGGCHRETVNKGDIILIATPGGGGFGK